MATRRPAGRLAGMDDAGGEATRVEGRGTGATALACLPTVAFGGFALLMMTRRVAGDRIWSDEQIFLGGAGLMARGEGLIYRDFFYTHAPLLALLTAGLFRVVSHWALAARLIDASCAATIAGLIFEAAHGRWSACPRCCGSGARPRSGPCWCSIRSSPTLAASGGTTISLPFFASRDSSSSPTGWAARGPQGWAIASGACAAAAATSRLTYAPPMIVFPLLILAAPGRPTATRWRLIGWWSLGAFLASLPSLVVIAHAPAAAWFENVRYPGLTERLASEAKLNWRLGLADKLGYCVSQVRRSGSLRWLIALTATALAVGLTPRGKPCTLAGAAFAARAMLLAAPLATAFVPTPTYQQYLYAPVPFAALAIAWSLGRLPIAFRAWAAAGLLPIAA